MKKKHDLTACLPFPEPSPVRAAATAAVHHPPRGSRGPLELSRLELADLRVHGSPLWPVDGASPSVAVASGPALEAAVARCAHGPRRGRGEAAVRPTATPTAILPSSPAWSAPVAPGARAVRQVSQSAFYLDLAGAVLIMALVVIAAILV